MCQEKSPIKWIIKIFVNSRDDVYIFLTYLNDSGRDVVVVGTPFDQFMEEDLEELQPNMPLASMRQAIYGMSPR